MRTGRGEIRSGFTGTEPYPSPRCSYATETTQRRESMGKGILLWLLGIPIPIIILLLLFWR